MVNVWKLRRTPNPKSRKNGWQIRRRRQWSYSPRIAARRRVISRSPAEARPSRESSTGRSHPLKTSTTSTSRTRKHSSWIRGRPSENTAKPWGHPASATSPKRGPRTTSPPTALAARWFTSLRRNCRVALRTPKMTTPWACRSRRSTPRPLKNPPDRRSKRAWKNPLRSTMSVTPPRWSRRQSPVWSPAADAPATSQALLARRARHPAKWSPRNPPKTLLDQKIGCKPPSQKWEKAHGHVGRVPRQSTRGTHGRVAADKKRGFTEFESPVCRVFFAANDQ